MLQAAKLAKKVNKSCMVCHYHNLYPLTMVMSGIPESQLVEPVARRHIKLDLFKPWNYRSDVNKRATAPQKLKDDCLKGIEDEAELDSSADSKK